MNTDEKIKYVNEIFYLKKEIKKLKAMLKKQAVPTKYVCRYCGKEATKPHGGRCPYSPYPNKCHEFIRA